MRSLPSFAYRYRNLLAGLPLVYAVVSTRWAWGNAAGAWLLAVALVLFGVLIRAWGVCHNSYAQRRNKTLAVTGPYAYVRNPLYLGNLLIIVGATAASRLIWLLPLVAAWCLGVYRLVVRHEEVRLVARYGGEYERYRTSVPGWIPRLRGVRSRAAIAGRSFRAAIVSQSSSLLVLVPFLIKEVDLFRIWSGH